MTIREFVERYGFAKVLPCARCGEYPHIVTTVLGGKVHYRVFCMNHALLTTRGWFASKNDALMEWNIDVLTRSFLDGTISWEEAKDEARALGEGVMECERT